MLVLAIQTRNISSGLRENSLKKTWPELPRFHRGVGGVGVGGCPPCIFTTIQHQITLLRKKKSLFNVYRRNYQKIQVVRVWL